MRKSMTIAVAAMLALAGKASAADLGHGAEADIYSSKPAFSWTGFYIGANGGYGWGKEHQQVVGVPPAHMDFVPDGGIAGGQVGVNWQASRGLVLGVEASLDWTDTGDRTQFAVPGAGLHQDLSDLRGIGDVSGRVGLAFGSGLVYGKGGVAWGRFDHSYIEDGNTYTSDTVDRVGWLVGGGVEFAFSPNWSAKVEYDYIDFGTGRFVLNGNAVQGVDFDYTVNLIKAGVNYRFGAPRTESLK